MRTVASGMLLAASCLMSACVVAGDDDQRFAQAGPGNAYGAPTIYRGSGSGSSADRYDNPSPGVRCDRYARVCYDRKGPELSLTREHFGRDAARRLEDQIGGNWKKDDIYKPKEGVKCDVEDEICTKKGEDDYLNTRQQFGRKDALDARDDDGKIRPYKKTVCDPATEVCTKNGETNVDHTRFVFGNRAAKEAKQDKKN